jgi:hypothetical protein
MTWSDRLATRLTIRATISIDGERMEVHVRVDRGVVGRRGREAMEVLSPVERLASVDRWTLEVCVASGAYANVLER